MGLIELVVTAFLLIAVVGSGIMAQRVFPDTTGLALLANAIATGGGLVALILAFGPQSGAHMNPVVTLAAAATDGLRWHAVPAYLVAQLVGAIAGVWLAHVMFDMPIWQLSQHARTGRGRHAQRARPRRARRSQRRQAPPLRHLRLQGAEVTEPGAVASGSR